MKEITANSEGLIRQLLSEDAIITQDLMRRKSREKPYILIYDHQSERLAMYGDDELIPLHCGDVIEVQKVDIESIATEPWQETRVEANVNGEWYLVDLYAAGEIPVGLAARRI